MANFRTPLSISQKLARWIWNSWRGFITLFSLLCMGLLAFSCLILGSPLLLISLGILVISFLLGSVGWCLGKVVNWVFKVNDAPEIGFEAVFKVSVAGGIGLVGTAAITLDLLSLVFLTISLVIILTVGGLIGAVVGLITSPLLILMGEPHEYWLAQQKKISGELASLTIEPDSPFLSTALLVAVKLNKLFKPTPREIKDFDMRDYQVEFGDFDPNQTKCALSGRDLGILKIEEDEKKSLNEEKVVIKGPFGLYYLKSEFDRSIIPNFVGQGRIVPSNLQIKFQPGKTTCPISMEELPEYDAKGEAEPVSRTPRGYYFAQKNINEHLSTKKSCPFTRDYLDQTLLTVVVIPASSSKPSLSASNLEKADQPGSLAKTCLGSSSLRAS
jgi:hypothetical protein